MSAETQIGRSGSFGDIFNATSSTLRLCLDFNPHKGCSPLALLHTMKYTIATHELAVGNYAPAYEITVTRLKECLRQIGVANSYKMEIKASLRDEADYWRHCVAF